MKCPFSYKFRDAIDNEKFLSLMEEGLSTLYSDDIKISEKVFKFFADIKKEIKNFIYIPMLNDNSLCEFKKNHYLGALTSQLEEDGYEFIMKYIFYIDKYFDESNYEEINFAIKRNSSFVKLFSN